MQAYDWSFTCGCTNSMNDRRDRERNAVLIKKKHMLVQSGPKTINKVCEFDSCLGVLDTTLCDKVWWIFLLIR